jgi:hypothetical protein
MHQGIMSERLFFGEGLRSMAAASDTAVALVFVGSMSGPQPNRTPAEDVGRNAETGSGDALLRVMDEFAAETDRGELRAAPLLFWGFSAAAGFGTTFGVLHPERTVGFVRYHTHRQGSPDDLDGLLGIPALLISGGKDTPARQQDAEEMWKTGRAAGAPWTVAVEPEAQHSSPEVGDATARDLAIPWMAAVLRARLAPDGRLRPVSSDGAFLADLAIGAVSPFATFSGDRRLANWLPDERTAAGWKIVVSPAR